MDDKLRTMDYERYGKPGVSAEHPVFDFGAVLEVEVGEQQRRALCRALFKNGWAFVDVGAPESALLEEVAGFFEGALGGEHPLEGYAEVLGAAEGSPVVKQKFTCVTGEQSHEALR